MDWTHRDPHCVPWEPERVEVVCAACGGKMLVEQTRRIREPMCNMRIRYRKCERCGWRLATKEGVQDQTDTK